MSTELVCIVIEHNGQLCHVSIPPERKALALRLIQGVFDDGVLACVKLPENWKKVPLTEALKP